jgi:hypothetical protein
MRCSSLSHPAQFMLARCVYALVPRGNLLRRNHAAWRDECVVRGDEFDPCVYTRYIRLGFDERNRNDALSRIWHIHLGERLRDNLGATSIDRFTNGNRLPIRRRIARPK